MIRKRFSSLTSMMLAGFLVLCVNLALFARGGKLPTLPSMVHDDTVILDDFEEGFSRWDASQGATIALADTAKTGEKALQIAYAFTPQQQKPEVTFNVKGLRSLEGERLRFWMKGDGSGNTLVVSCYDKIRKEWIEQVRLTIDFDIWKHLEIPASNPTYFYYKSVTDFRFTLQNDHTSSTSSGDIFIDSVEYVSPVVVTTPSKPKVIPAPIFNSWGGPARNQIIFAARAGVNLHCIPMGFPTGDEAQFEKNCKFVAERAKWCKDAGMLAGLQFYNNPPADWAKAHSDMFMVNEEGMTYYEYYAGGSAVSPWNPASQKLWHEYIIKTLKYFKEHDLLKYIDVVMLSPGEEGELCYQWDHIWAFDKYAVQDYRNYLRTLYDDDIAAMNDDCAASYDSFDAVMPPKEYYPDREHWVFQDFYRYSMLKWCVFLADAVEEEFTPKYWLWLPHTLPSYPNRYHAARYPQFYIDNLKRLGYMDIANIAALDWQGVQDVQFMQALGVRIVGEISGFYSKDAAIHLTNQCIKYQTDGIYVQILEKLFANGEPTEAGTVTRGLLQKFSQQYQRQEKAGMRRAKRISPGTYEFTNNGDNWYKVLADTDNTIDASITFNAAKGDLDLMIYDPTLLMLGKSNSVSNEEHIAITDTAAKGYYYIHVQNYSGGTGGVYTLTVNVSNNQGNE